MKMSGYERMNVRSNACRPNYTFHSFNNMHTKRKILINQLPVAHKYMYIYREIPLRHSHQHVTHCVTEAFFIAGWCALRSFEKKKNSQQVREQQKKQYIKHS